MSIYCNVFGHDFKVSKRVTYHVKEYKCSNCKKQLTTSSNGQLRELSPKYKEINSILYKIHNKKQAKTRRNDLITAYK